MYLKWVEVVSKMFSHDQDDPTTDKNFVILEIKGLMPNSLS
jgi:hypothetical protein